MPEEKTLGSFFMKASVKDGKLRKSSPPVKKNNPINRDNEQLNFTTDMKNLGLMTDIQNNIKEQKIN